MVEVSNCVSKGVDLITKAMWTSQKEDDFTLSLLMYYMTVV